MSTRSSPFTDLLKQPGRRAVVLDGGLATELEHQGQDLSQGDLWSARLLAENPEAVQQVHRAYYAAGADVATTCSYQASHQGFAQAGYAQDAADELMRRSVQLADAARCSMHDHTSNSRRRLVAFSCGTYGAVSADGTEYDGNFADKVTVEQLMDFHMRRLEAVAHETAIDLVAFETIPCAKELEAIARLARTQALPAPAWVSVSCKDDSHTCHGEDFAASCLPLLIDCDAIVAVGFNCTAPRHIVPLLHNARCALEQHRAQSRKLLLAYPNSGEGYVSSQQGWDGMPDLTAEQYGSAARQWVAAGARLIGGCCRTTPDHIRGVAANVIDHF
ncbi:hypothetical protein WJX73_000567 [Symbiochloris irregularis]|uniref:Hcy-binding domain-containing protein n=1 Tax=Symbiochloris irregularis TaxID=706552 RepID=A0AAW1PDL5_9CHLO